MGCIITDYLDLLRRRGLPKRRALLGGRNTSNECIVDNGTTLKKKKARGLECEDLDRERKNKYNFAKDVTTRILVFELEKSDSGSFVFGDGFTEKRVKKEGGGRKRQFTNASARPSCARRDA